jgi:cytochrome c5
MKRTILIGVLVAVMVMAMAGVAFATRYDSTYSDPSAWITANPGVSPHGGYSVSSTKCNVCHAVHNPGNPAATTVDTVAGRTTRATGTNFLLRTANTQACITCHVSNTYAIVTVYNEDVTLYNGNGASRTASESAAHNSGTNDGGYVGFGCTSCHNTHGALSVVASADAYLASKLLVTTTSVDPDAPAWASDATTNTPRDAASSQNLSRWCSQCHIYYNTNAHGTTGTDSHPMVAATGSASAGSQYCVSCHNAGVINSNAAANGVNSFPHYTTAARFMNVAASSVAASSPAVPDANGQVKSDGACLKCHTNGTTTGIGINY